MMFLWACAGIPLGVYNIVENFNLALQIQPQILTFLSLITFAQCLYYEKVPPPPTTLMAGLLHRQVRDDRRPGCHSDGWHRDRGCIRFTGASTHSPRKPNS